MQLRIVRRTAPVLYRSPFAVSVWDPPWKPKDKLPGDTRGADKQYETMDTEDIAAKRGFSFAFPPLADDHVMFMWRLASMIDDAFYVLKTWGFPTKSEIIWDKETTNGEDAFGMGRYTRNSHEVCIIAARGRAASQVVHNHSVRSIYRAKLPTYEPDHPKVLSGEVKAGSRIHSAKPPGMFKDVFEKMCKGPYFEGFARECQPGWTAAGNEIPGGVMCLA